jgi:hypothetical protein
MSNTMNQDFSNVNLKLSMSGSQLANILIPHLVTALASNATLRNAIVAAIMPSIRAQVASIAASTAGGKSNKP